MPELLAKAGIDRCRLRGVGIGFGGPVDDATHTVIKSHQIEGWDDFPLADWISDVVGLPAVLGNDADVAGLAEALHGAGKGAIADLLYHHWFGHRRRLHHQRRDLSRRGRGAAEIGHMHRRPVLRRRLRSLKHLASGWGIGNRAQVFFEAGLDGGRR